MVVICSTPACTFGVAICKYTHDMFGWLVSHDTLLACSFLLIHRNSLSSARWLCTLSCAADVLVQLHLYLSPVCFSQCFSLALDWNYLVSLMAKMMSISAGRSGLIPFSYQQWLQVETLVPYWCRFLCSSMVQYLSTSCGLSFPVSLLGCLHLLKSPCSSYGKDGEYLR